MKLVREALDLPEVVDLKVSVSDRTAFVEHWSTLDPQVIVEKLNEKHLGARLKERNEVGVTETSWRASFNYISLFLQVALFCVGVGLQHSDGNVDGNANANKKVHVMVNVAFGACIALSCNLFHKAFIAILRMQPNVEFLMATAMAGSIVLGMPREAAVVGSLVNVMEAVTSAAMSAVDKRLQGSISVPPSTLTLQGGVTIPALDLKAGMVVLVRAGDGIPADGDVLKGAGNVDENRITGEAQPVRKMQGDKVFSGSVLQSGFLEITASADVDESFQGKVLESVRQAKNTFSGTQRLVDKFAVYYTPAIILIAVIVAVRQEDFKQFLVILVAGCPCALLGAAPFVQAAAVSVLAARHRFLVKDTGALESLAKMKWLGIDKTGTLTNGNFKLIEMRSVSSFDKKQLHMWAAAIETKDNHPLAQSVVQSYTGCLVAFAGSDGLPEVTQFKREGRCGVRGTVEGRTIGVGNTDFLEASSIPLEGAAAELSKQWTNSGAVLFVTVDKEVGGVLLMDDSIRSDAANAVAMLRKLGVNLVMLTGDKQSSADRAALAAGIDTVHAGLLPEDKGRLILEASFGGKDEGLKEQLQPSRRGPCDVGFVGDGLNDCVALANAHMGIVMQEVGSQATVDAAAAVLQGDLGELPAVIVVAQRVRVLVLANIALALTINASLILAAITVGVPLWLSVACDSGSLLLVLANSLWPLCWNIAPAEKAQGKEDPSSAGKMAYEV